MEIYVTARFRPLLLALLIMITGLGRHCDGQQQPPDLSDASLEQLGNIQVYSASMHLQSSGDAPSSVTVIGSAEIQEHGYRTLADILRSARSFYVTYDRNYSSVGVRGFARPGDYNTRILLMVDGHRMNDNVYDAAMIGTEFPIEVDMIERVEIIRGPSSSLYGSNALFAVINVITMKAPEANGLEVSVEASSFGTYMERASYGLVRPKFKLLLDGSFYRSKGQSRLYFPELDDPSTNNGIANHADGDQLGTALATLTFRDFTLQAAYGTREKGIPTGSYGTVLNNTGTRTSDAHAYIDARYDRTFGGDGALLARAFYDRTTYQGTYMTPSSVDPSQIVANLDYGDGKWWGSQVQVAKTILRRNRVTAGAEYRDNFRQDQSNYDLSPFSNYLNDHRSSSIFGMYVQDEVPITNSLALNAGIRFDRYATFALSTDPRFALVYRPGSKTNLKIIYGKSFRIPNVYERYYAAYPNAANPSLRPEKLSSTEFVWEQDLSEHLWISFSGFDITAGNLINQQAETGGLFAYRNLQNVRSDGAELEAKGRLPHGFEGVASYTFQEARDRDSGQFLNNSPRHLAKLDLTQALFQRKLFAGLNAQYRSGMRTFSGTSVSPATIVDFELSGPKLGKHLDLSAGFYNILNKTYYDPATTAMPENSIKQDGRTFRVKVTWKLGGR